MQFIDLQVQLARIRPQVDAAIAEVLEHGRFIMGPEVAAFEAELGQYTGAGHVVSCANGTDALVLALRALGIGTGHHVVVPSFTFAATAEAVALVGATPVFVDVDEATFNVVPQQVATAVVEFDAVAVIAVDLFGLPADYPALQDLLPPDVHVIADAAQSIGGRTPEGHVGSLTRLTTTSFFPAKPLGCFGDGGAVFTDDAEVAAHLRSLRVHGKGTHKYDNERIGTNSRLDTIQAAILRCKLAILEDEMVARSDVAARYAEGLADVVAVPGLPADVRSAWAQYTIRTGRREQLQTALSEAGIPSVVYYPLPLHQQTAYRNFPIADGGCPTSEALAHQVLSLPMDPYLDEGTQDEVIAAVREVLS